MPSRTVAARELEGMLKALAHADRIKIIEELATDEADVSELSERLGIPASRMSQHLRVLRLNHIVCEHRDGRRHLYQLVNPQMASWLIQGIDLLLQSQTASTPDALRDARRIWGNGG